MEGFLCGKPRNEVQNFFESAVSRIQEGVLRGVTSGFVRMVVQRDDGAARAGALHPADAHVRGAVQVYGADTAAAVNVARRLRTGAVNVNTSVFSASRRAPDTRSTGSIPWTKRLVLLGFNGFRRFRQDGRRQRRLRHQQGAGDLDAVPVAKGRLSPASDQTPPTRRGVGRFCVCSAGLALGRSRCASFITCVSCIVRLAREGRGSNGCTFCVGDGRRCEC